MKFTQLQMGQRFRYQGKVFSKITPLMAQAEGADNQKLIPRSASVEPLGTPSEQATPQGPSEIPVAQLDRAMNALACDINDIITESGLNAEETGNVLRQLQSAFLKTRRILNLP